MPQVTVDLFDDEYRRLMELVASKPGRTPEDALLELLVEPLNRYHFLQNKPQNFMVELTEEQAAQARELAEHWGVTPDEAVRRAAVDGIDLALQIKHHDEREAAGLPRTSDLDDDIPL